MTDVAATYQARYETYLMQVAINLRELVASHLVGIANVDRVTARAKEPDRFAQKAGRSDEQGQPKYRHPLTEVQDQLGVRVVVFYESTVETVSTLLRRYLRPIEEKPLVPESHWAFGYFGWHSVMALPADVIPQEVAVEGVPRFFELQIKTLFQHAWSEANHDLGYKPISELSGDHQRRLAFAAAQAWGADRAFEELRAELASDGRFA